MLQVSEEKVYTEEVSTEEVSVEELGRMLREVVALSEARLKHSANMVCT